mgnify:CR=1 FL=1
MPRYPYRDVGTLLDRNFRNNLKANFDDIEADIRELYDGVDDLDTRIDNIVADVGNSNTEIVDARYDAVNNVTYPTLKDRLDDTSDKIGILSAEKVDKKIGLLSQKIDFSPLFTVDTEDTHTSLQGMCVTDQYIVFAAIANDNDNTYLYVIDKNNYTLVNTIKNYNFEHANSLTYNPDNNTIVIANCINNGVQSKKITIVDANLLATANPSNFIKQVLTMEYTVQSVAYYNHRYYVFQGDHTTVHVLDDSFNEIRTFTLPNSKIIQNVDIYNDLIFVSRIDPVSVVEVYDLYGNYVKKYLVPVDILGSELEGFSHLSDGMFISGFNGDKHYFYISRVYDTTSSYISAEIPYYHRKASVSTLYVNSSYTGLVSDGSQTYPFKTLAQLTDFINKNQILGTIIVNINGTFNETLNLTSLKTRIVIQKDSTASTAAIDNVDLRYCSYLELINIDVFGARDSGEGVFVQGVDTLYITSCTIQYTRDENTPSSYTPVRAIGSKVVFDNGTSTINGARSYVINATASTIHVANGLMGSNTVGIRLKASTLYYASANFNIGNSIWQLESGSQYFSDIDNGTWQNITLQNGFTPYSSAFTPQYKIKRIGGELYLYLRGAVTSQSSMNEVVVGNIPITQYLRGLPYNIEFLSIMSDNNGVTQHIRWRIDLATGNLIVTSTSYGNTSVPTGKWCQIQLNGYPLVP